MGVFSVQTCIGCGMLFEPTPLAKYRTYCSSACYQRLWRRSALVVERKECVVCGKQYMGCGVGRRAKYCGRQCRSRASYARHLQSIAPRVVEYVDDESPLEWDGRTQISVPPAPKFHFEGHCLTCGAVDYRYVTRERIRLLRPYHCDRCGVGRMFVEDAEIGSIHSATLARVA